MTFARGLIAALTLWIAACDQKDTARESADAAEKQVKLADYRGAIRIYEGMLDSSPKSADVHYKIAVLYDDKLKESLDAIHHYDRYLDIAPTGSHAKEAKDARADCERKLQVKLAQGGYMSQTEAARLKNENESLRKTINELRNPKPAVDAHAAQADPNVKDKMPPGARAHTVGKGDTLASIALKYYKNRAFAGQIKDANFNQLGGKDIIKPGQVLIIPEIGKKKPAAH